MRSKKLQKTFNEYLGNVTKGSNLRESTRNINFENEEGCKKIKENFGNNNFSFKTVSKKDVFNLIKQLPGNRATVSNSILVSVLKESKSAYYEKSTDIFNNCIRRSTKDQKTFNECLANITKGSNLRESTRNINFENEEGCKKIKENFGNNNFSFKTVSKKDVFNLIKQLPGNRATVSNSILVSVLKESKSAYYEKSTDIFNNCIRRSTFPEILNHIKNRL